MYNGLPLESVKSFTYLGVVFTPQLAATKHVDHVVAKANSRVAQLFHSLPIQNLPLHVVLQLFDTYILPVLAYGLPVWLPSLSHSAELKLNRVYTKFIKRYLGVPFCTPNSAVFSLLNNTPLSHRLKRNHLKAFLSMCFPPALSGLKLNPPPPPEDIPDFTPDLHLPLVTTSLDLSSLPSDSSSRRPLLYAALDLLHPHLCARMDFHSSPDDNCLCRVCHRSANTVHHHTVCLFLSNLSISKLLTYCLSLPPKSPSWQDGDILYSALLPED